MNSVDSKVRISKTFNNKIICEIINDDEYDRITACTDDFEIISINKSNMFDDVLIEIPISIGKGYDYKKIIGVTSNNELIYKDNIFEKIFVQEIKMVDNEIHFVLKVPSHLLEITGY